MEIPEFLIEMSKQMNTDPNRMTSHPFWQVRCKRYIVTAQGYSEHHFEIVGDDGVVWSSLDQDERLHDYFLEFHEVWCCAWVNSENDMYKEDGYESFEEYFRENFGTDCDELPDELSKVFVQEIEEIISTHLTEPDAKWFIQRKQHDYPKLYTYVESAYWSPQLRELQDWIKSLTDSA